MSGAASLIRKGLLVAQVKNVTEIPQGSLVNLVIIRLERVTLTITLRIMSILTLNKRVNL